MTTIGPVTRTTGRGRLTFRRNLPDVLWTLGSLALGVGLLQLAVSTNILPRQHFPDVPAIAAALGREVGSGSFWDATLATIRGAAIGLGVATLIAVPLGLAVGKSEILFSSLRFVLEALRPIPVVALIPLVVLVVGAGFSAKLLLVAFAGVFPILFQTIYGVRDVDPVALRTAKAFRLGHVRSFFSVSLPAALPFMITGVRISASLCLLVAISAELIIGIPGLGQAILVAQASNATDVMYALILTTGLLGVAFNTVVALSVRSLFPWVADVGRGREE